MLPPSAARDAGVLSGVSACDMQCVANRRGGKDVGEGEPVHGVGKVLHHPHKMLTN